MTLKFHFDDKKREEKTSAAIFGNFLKRKSSTSLLLNEFHCNVIMVIILVYIGIQILFSLCCKSSEW